MIDILQIKTNNWIPAFKYHFCIINDDIIYYKSIYKERTISTDYHKYNWKNEKIITK